MSASTANPFKAIGALRKLRRLQKIGGDRSLEDILPAELYAMFVAAKNQYAPKDGKVLKLRPLFAAQELQNNALRSVGLTDRVTIARSLRKMAKKHGVLVTSTRIEVKLDKALEILRDIPLDVELRCLETTLLSIRSDLSASLVRANAWADGDASALRDFEYPDVEASCTQAIFNGPDALEALKQGHLQWIESAERVLRESKVSFGSLPIRELIRSGGLLDVLRKKGYFIRGQGDDRGSRRKNQISIGPFVGAAPHSPADTQLCTRTSNCLRSSSKRVESVTRTA
jgi:uncharacterized protein YbaP (TraB family)